MGLFNSITTFISNVQYWFQNYEHTVISTGERRTAKEDTGGDGGEGEMNEHVK